MPQPLGGYPEYKLSLQQKRQATLLYHWTSREYLQGLKDLIDALIKGVDVNLTLAKLQGRDELLTNERWGVRDTATNWSTFVFPALEDFRKSTIWHIAQVANDVYGITGASQCARMISEHSSLWMTPEEEQQFSLQANHVFRYAFEHDKAVREGGSLDDFSMTLAWREKAALFPRLPKFRVRTDIESETGERPPRTGVYVAQDDSHASLQFAWRGAEPYATAGALGNARCFTAFGSKLLTEAGRDSLWVDDSRMAAIAIRAMQNKEADDFGLASIDRIARNPKLGSSALAFSSFSERPCKWYFVERIEGEYDDEQAVPANSGNEAGATRLRVEGGQQCPRDGWWFTPAKAGSRRHFQQGEVMPAFSTDYGTTIWQWDEQQGQ